MHVVRYDAARKYNKLRIVRVDIRIVQSAGCLQMLLHICNRLLQLHEVVAGF